MSDPVTIYVCKTCRPADFVEDGRPRPGARLGEALLRAVRAQGREGGIAVKGVSCLSVCKRSCTVAVAAPGKFAYVIGDLTPEDGPDALLAFADAYAGAEDGITPWRARPESIRKGTVARVPPLGHAAFPVEELAEGTAP
jgi:predicted metal-binding protein